MLRKTTDKIYGHHPEGYETEWNGEKGCKVSRKVEKINSTGWPKYAGLNHDFFQIEAATANESVRVIVVYADVAILWSNTRLGKSNKFRQMQ